MEIDGEGTEREREGERDLEGSRAVSRERAEDERRLVANERELERGRLRCEKR